MTDRQQMDQDIRRAEELAWEGLRNAHNRLLTVEEIAAAKFLLNCPKTVPMTDHEYFMSL